MFLKNVSYFAHVKKHHKTSAENNISATKFPSLPTARYDVRDQLELLCCSLLSEQMCPTSDINSQLLERIEDIMFITRNLGLDGGTFHNWPP